MTSRQGHLLLILIGILCCAALLRIPGIFWGTTGLGSQVFTELHPDEGTHVSIAEAIRNPKKTYEKFYITGFGRQLALAADVTETITGGELNSDDLHLTGRWLSTAYGVASVLMLFCILLTVSGDTTMACWGALFLSLCSLAVTNSHFAVADAAAVFWIMCTSLFSYKWFQNGTQKSLLLAFISGAVALAVKISVAAIAPLLAILFFTFKGRLKKGPLLAGLAVFFLSLLIATGFEIGPEELRGIWDDIFSGNMSIIPRHRSSETLAAVLVSIFPALSLPLVLLAILGGIQIRKTWRSHTAVWLCFGLPALFQFVIVLMSDLPFERHLLPFAPLLCGLAAHAWIQALQPLPGFKKTLWSIPLLSYLIFFAIDGEMPFWHDNRIQARQWLEYSIEPGSSILLGRYTGFSLPPKKYRVKREWYTETHPITKLDVIVLHEAHTYRYERSRLSPFHRPAKDNIYHPLPFYLKSYDDLVDGDLPFSQIKTIPCPGQGAIERKIYQKFWGTFQSFVGDIRIFKKDTPVAN